MPSKHCRFCCFLYHWVRLFPKPSIDSMYVELRDKPTSSARHLLQLYTCCLFHLLLSMCNQGMLDQLAGEYNWYRPFGRAFRVRRTPMSISNCRTASVELVQRRSPSHHRSRRREGHDVNRRKLPRKPSPPHNTTPARTVSSPPDCCVGALMCLQDVSALSSKNIPHPSLQP